MNRHQMTGRRDDGRPPGTLGKRASRPRLLLPSHLFLLVLLAGCLPSSGRRDDRSLVPADSASVALAATVPVDTLALGWEAAARPDDPMPLPTTIGWAGTGDAARIVVVETKEGSVRLFTPSGRQARHVSTGGGPESYPYLAGIRRGARTATGASVDTAVVLERGTNRLAFVPLDSSGAVRRIAVPAGASAALATDAALYVRTGGGAEGEPAFLLRLSERGREAARFPLRGRPWRASGFLREWDGRIAALSGYRPVVDVLRPGRATGARPDTLALRGFASPALTRSAQFIRGDAKQPPLLTSSAAAVGADLFVLNLRDNHVRIDVYGADGALRRVLVSPGPHAMLAYVPVDVAARRAGGVTEFAVLMQRPSGLIQQADSRIVLYRWSE